MDVAGPYNPRMEKSYENRFGFLIADVGRLSGRLYDERAKALGLTRAQSRVLAYLSWQGEMNQARLAEMLEVTPISLARLLDRMQDSGWIERVPDDEDRRAYRIRLTRRARGIFPQVLKLGDAVTQEALGGFSQAERDALIGLLRRVRANLVGMLEEGKGE